MRTTRSLVLFALLAAASCALPTPAFGQSDAPPSEPSPSVASASSEASAPATAVSTASSDVASASQAPAPAPTPASDASPAPAPIADDASAPDIQSDVESEAELTRRSKEQNIEDWAKRHFHAIAHRFDTELAAWYDAAKEDLKRVLGLVT